MDLGEPYYDGKDLIIVTKEEFEEAMEAFPSTIQDGYSDGGIIYMDGRKWGRSWLNAQDKFVNIDAELGRYVEGKYYLNPRYFNG